MNAPLVLKDTLIRQAQAARQASLTLANLTTLQKNEVLLALAKALRQRQPEILAANALDIQQGESLVYHGGLTQASFKRLVLNADKVEQMALNMESVARLPDPVGTVQLATRLDQGLELYRVTCPLGVLLVIFESRPEVVVQISALTLKSGNAVILKGGSEALHSNQMLTQIIQETLRGFAFVPPGAVTLLGSREEVSQMILMHEWIDLIVPRGSNTLVRQIQASSRIPVLAHADGICHIYLDESADAEKSMEIVVDAKTQYPAVCNAAETLLIHERFPDDTLAEIFLALQDKQVELRCCPQTRERMMNIPELRLWQATEEDWATEYTDLILSIKTVPSLEAAIAHINTYGSKHTDAIVTEERTRAEAFMNQVDAASVFWNASTRFADGFRYGFGAEVGISTSKTHARGPVGLEGLVLYKYKLYGQGQGVARYAEGGRAFLHQPLELEEAQRFLAQESTH